MAYDEILANRLREALSGQPKLTEKAMFGGLAFLINGNMSVAASGQGGLLLRIDPTEAERFSGEPHASRAVMGGREMDGWLRIDEAALDDEATFTRWVERGIARSRALPPK